MPRALLAEPPRRKADDFVFLNRSTMPGTGRAARALYQQTLDLPNGGGCSIIRMIRRLYIHNFRCLENFELPIAGRPSVLLIGNNGAGKSTVGFALEVFQKIARGTNRVGELVKPKDLPRGRPALPMRFELEVELNGTSYAYTVSFDYPDGFRELRVFDEKLTVGTKTIYSRQLGKIHLTKSGQEKEATFFIDWHLVALPIIQQQAAEDPVSSFRQWLAQMLILRPMPSLIAGISEEQTLQPNVEVTNLGAWFAGLMSHAPSSYTKVYDYLKQMMPDLDDITNPAVGAEVRNLFLQFSKDKSSVKLTLEELSDGEKCFMISALVFASNKAYGPVLCFWDEPDNFLAPSEVGHFVLGLRRAFQSGGQFIATSHNTEAIRRFSDENTLVFYRNSHLEPTLVRPLETFQHAGDIVSALVRGDLGA